MSKIKKISLNVSEEIKHILPDILEKDLQDDEIICPVCHGLGVKMWNNPYGIKGDTSEEAKRSMFPYKHQSLLPCPNCYNGVVKLCEYCGKQLPKGRLKCDCEQQKEKDEEEKRIEYQETIDKATEIELKDTSYYIYDEQSDKYFTDEDEFVEYYWDLYLNKAKEHGCYNFDGYFEKYIPKVLWNCEETKISMDADSIIDNACEELHEDARDNIYDEKELQEFLDKWCAKQSGTTTYYPCYREYVKVQKVWFYE